MTCELQNLTSFDLQKGNKIRLGDIVIKIIRAMEKSAPNILSTEPKSLEICHWFAEEVNLEFFTGSFLKVSDIGIG